jgi:hypothetical protein
MGSRAEMIGKLAVVVHEFGKVVLVVTIFLALYQGGWLAYLMYVDKFPFAETGKLITTGLILLDYGVAFGIALFVAVQALKHTLAKRLPK